ncbi:MAG: hypothetical protein EBR82_58575 [Caulobacteraceae bacterium]|jgi:hypothetical protein|nr:hypothetical protein [Caulobacteraceae bacterium]
MSVPSVDISRLDAVNVELDLKLILSTLLFAGAVGTKLTKAKSICETSNVFAEREKSQIIY